MWKILYYESKSGRNPVKEYIDGLSVKTQAKVIRTIDLLMEFGIDLSTPFVKCIKDKVWELRVGRSRILYFITTGKTIILIAWVYKENKKNPSKRDRNSFSKDE